MSRRRSRRRGSRSRRWLLALLVVGVATYGGLSTAAFSTADVDRQTATDVVDDGNGAHALDVASAVYVNSTSTLVTVTNRLGRSATVTVTLRDDSTHVGDLVVDGATAGNQTSFDLAAGDSQSVKIDVPDDDSLVGETVYFHVDAADPGLDVSASDRSTTVES